MQNFQINFSHPWLLLLLIPALFFTLLPYFRLSKKYRRTRNRVTSIVLHLLVMVLAISALAGLRFDYQIPNDQNEIILLVDVSETEEQAAEARDEFVQLVLNDSQYDNFNVGIVTFGFDQQYAVPLTDEVEGIYDAYIAAPLPDTSATNIAAALNYAKTLFNNPEAGKIVLITDGKETDEEAMSVIRSVAVQGIKVDTAYVASEYEGNEVQIVGVELPDYHIGVGKECSIIATVQSKSEASATVELIDNGVVNEEFGRQSVTLTKGSQTVAFTHSFAQEGIHELLVRVTLTDDLLEQNNEYYTYLNLELYNKILIIERLAGESTELVNLLETGNTEQESYEIDVKALGDTTIPSTVDGLRAYDQVILNNISYKELNSIPSTDKQETFDLILKSYVEEYGGGLFTVGGDDENGNVNAYQNMTGTIYQSILPIQAIRYTPPVGVMIIIDTSGSMTGGLENGTKKLDAAKNGASACLDALTDRDYIGVMQLDTEYSTVLDLTPRSQQSKIQAAIHQISDTTGGTEYTKSINHAGEALRALKSVAKRHIIIISDGEISDPTKSIEVAKGFYETDGITLSVVNILRSSASEPNAAIGQLVEAAGGKSYVANNEGMLIQQIKEDLNAPEIKDVNIPEEGFHPIIYDAQSPLVKDLARVEGEGHNKLSVTLDGFYGGKVKANADLILVGDYEVPIYAQWELGKGMVGSFMADLQGKLTADFMADINGQTFIRNVVQNLMPTENIRPNPITMTLKSDNYTNQASVYVDLDTKAGERVEGQIVKIDSNAEIVTSMNTVTVAPDGMLLAELPCYVKSPLTETNNYSRCSFVIKQGGVYKIILTKYNADGTVAATLTTYKSFAYSEEYDTYVEESDIDLKARLDELAERGNGVRVQDLEDPREIFEGFVTAIDKTFDPRIIFMIAAIVFFLLDIAVRKFKFKWLHEIIRDYKKKKNGEL